MSSLSDYMIKHILEKLPEVNLSSMQIRILLQLSDDHSEDRGSTIFGPSEIAKRVGLTAKNARLHLLKLQKLGVIEGRPRISEDGRFLDLDKEYRFWFDRPFDRESTLKTEMLQRLQAQHRAGKPVQMRFDPLPEAGGGSPLEIEGPVEAGRGEPHPAIEGGPPLNSTNTRERENAPARENASQGAASDMRGMVVQIALAHPYAILRRWRAADVPVAVLVAIHEAIRAEAGADPLPLPGGGSPPEAGRGAAQMEAAVKLLEDVERIARDLPRSEWRFLKSLDKFMRLREYRMEAHELVHTDRNRGGGSDGIPQPDRATDGPGRKPPSAAVERGVASRHNIDDALERRRRRNAGRVDEADAG